MTDLILDDADGNQVTVIANVIKSEGSDFILDSSARRRPHNPLEPPQSPLRRALVHDQNDGLTLNYNNDYPGGITINSVAAVTPKKGDKMISNLVINGGIQFEIQTMVHTPGRGGIGVGVVVPGTQSVDLQEHLQEIVNSLNTNIKELHTEVDNLTARVAALEGR